MSTETKANYSEADVAVILQAVPFDLDGAKALATELGRGEAGWRSVVAKVKSLESDESIEGERPFYLAKPAHVTKTGAPVERKADMVGQIAAMLGTSCDSLVKASKADLQRVREALVKMSPESE